ncbi:gliding motility lipoprotein GldB [Croceitalea rosinachiae]|uniref:Gliding motility lipoprotein GldB n=1 Tax=Croceitalea rosinachiae TaxID=3075596 RepID=A0ABU3A5R5_9FLAO|nr:gliding motility lipoprotein GldB [Croceitalea sp. F388]MDT0605514.1 gliding motility lipoprotein GldB [Croceitalea sp. F388]
MKWNSKFFLISFLMLSVISCKEEDKTAAEIAQIPVALELSRFDLEFANAASEDISNLKIKYPYLFSQQYSDSVWIEKLTDTLQLELQEEVRESFGDFSAEEEAIESLFKHIKYYFPAFEVPQVVTIISDVQYDNRVVLTDSLLLIGLDNYLGSDHRFYAGLPNYVAQNLDQRYLTSDVASAFSKTINRYPRNRTFLSRMLYYGKELYLKDKLLPNTQDFQRINYTSEEMDWANINEEQIWRYFVERELLYSTDSKLDRRFLDPAPFSKFQLELDSESPGRLGRYLGWQIIRAFMEKNPKVTLLELLDMPADDIFKQSNYKPKK